jgi:hypothetical protein
MERMENPAEIIGPADPANDLIRPLLAAVRKHETRLKEALNRNPLESLVCLVLGGAAVYWTAERGRNEKVTTFWDAVEYVGT